MTSPAHPAIAGARVGVALPGSLIRGLGVLEALEEQYLPELGEASEDADLEPFEPIVRNLHPRISLQSFATDARDAEKYSWNRRVEKYNALLLDPAITREEKAHARIVNDYREMMGRRRLFLDPRLCRAARKHSGVCNAAGDIWHEGSDGTPQDRADAEKFPGGVGENVALGYSSPSEIWWRGWYKASDHHRNALTEQYTCMGYGYRGNIGTQMFGSIDPPGGFPVD